MADRSASGSTAEGSVEGGGEFGGRETAVPAEVHVAVGCGDEVLLTGLEREIVDQGGRAGGSVQHDGGRVAAGVPPVDVEGDGVALHGRGGSGERR